MATQKKTTKKTTAPAGKAPQDRQEKKTPAQVQEERRQALEARQEAVFTQRVQAASDDLDALEESVTQREWLLVTQGLDRTRDQINTDGSLRLLALGYIKRKRETGDSGWNDLLEMTDKDLVRLHGFPDETPEETRVRLERQAQPTPPEERNRVEEPLAADQGD